MFSSWILAVALATAEGSPCRLADIRPAPRTVLVDLRGKPFDLASLKGKIVVVSFVYTTCNGTCPVTTAALSRIQKELQRAKLWRSAVEFVSITLDPKRDTPEALSQYARIYSADVAAWHFLTGAPAEVDKVIKGWDMWVRSNSAGVLDHPSRVFLIDARGHEREIYNLEFLTPEAVTDDVKELLEEARGNRVSKGRRSDRAAAPSPR